MDQTSTQQTPGTKQFFDVAKYPLVELTREFNAPVERLWQAWTTPQIIKEWWGPENYSCPEAKMDVRVGGKSLLAMRGPDGKVIYSGGTYEVVEKNQRLVTSDSFMDASGNIIQAKDIGMPGDWPEACRITVEFKSLGEGASELQIKHEGIPKEMHDDCVSGWSSSIDKLDNVVEQQ